jgi:hypothetical protein
MALRQQQPVCACFTCGLLTVANQISMRITAVLRAYFDDSHDGKCDRIFWISSYMPAKEGWIKLGEIWHARAAGIVSDMTDCLGAGLNFDG